MYIVRWLVKHPVIAMWVLGAIAIFLSRAAPHKSTHETEGTVATHHVEETQNTVAHKAKSEVITPTKEEKKEVNAANEVAKINPQTVGAPDVELATDEEDAKATVANESAETNSATAINKIATVVDDGKNTTGSAVKKVAEGIVQKTENEVSEMVGDTIKDEIVQKVRDAQPTNMATVQAINKHDSVTVDDASNLAQTNSASELLVMAREAYWNNGFDEAAELYMQLIKLKPNVLDFKGELGNVYWRQGYPKKAAELYSEIALPMIENGNSDRVANMVGFIGLFYPERAAKIHQTLMFRIGSN